MKTTIRSRRFTIGMVLFLVIILLLSVSSVYYLNKLSVKSNAILKENHYSVVYANGMSENLTNINQEITNCALIIQNPDSTLINKELKHFDKSLLLEKNNITEIGEGKLVSEIEKEYNEYTSAIREIIKSQKIATEVVSLQMRFDTLYRQLNLLSQINEKAIEEKTNDTRVFAKNASLQMSFIATLCFLVAYGFSFSFSSYFNDRFYKLYDGIKGMASNKYRNRLSFDGKDEFHEISLVINEMADKLNEGNEKRVLPLQKETEANVYKGDIEELKRLLNQLKSLEDQAAQVISKFEKYKL